MANDLPLSVIEAGELLGDPQDWAAKQEELLQWTGSAFLAGETDKSDWETKGDLYGWLCGLLGWLSSAECAAKALARTANETQEGVGR